MFTRDVAVWALSIASVVLGSPVVADEQAINNTDYQTLQDRFQQANTVALGLLDQQNGTCNSSNVKIRREWDVLSTEEKKEYISAVRCLQTTPAITPASLGSGIKTRFDDFIGTHLNQTLEIHYTGNFLTWHRYFIHLYEEALHECGYTGTMPYWNWPKTAITGLHASPVFDGSETSLSGDGAYIANKSDIDAGGGLLPDYWLPSGTGGGCVTSGPFVNYTVNLGPVALNLPGGISATNPYNDTGVFSWNPRCFKRDLTDEINQQYANASSVLSLLSYDNIADFQLVFQGVSPDTLPGGTTIGVHGGGHMAMGGDPGRDLFSSPGDPAFYLHHTMMDKVWWLWQMQDPASRVSIDGKDVIAGTLTFNDSPPSANMTLDAWVSYGYAAGPERQIKELLSTTAGPFCYIYE